ncbi:RUN domain-containing protein 1, partial [Elysia marginata]
GVFSHPEINSCVIDSNSEHSTLYAGAGDNNIYAWDIASGQYKSCLSGHTDYIHKICLKDNGQGLVSVSEDGTARIWDLRANEICHIVKPYEHEIFSAGNSNVLNHWSLTGDHKMAVPVSPTAVYSMGINDKSKSNRIVNPAKVKEKLVDQLKTQIVDLERFIEFLQGEAASPGPLGKERCLCPMHEDAPGASSSCSQDSKSKSKFNFGSGAAEGASREQAKLSNESATNIMKKALTVLQIYVISQLGCGSRDFKRNLLKKTARGNHWGDLRAKLELAINKCIEVAEQQKQEAKEDTDTEDYSSDSDELIHQSSPALVAAVRRDLAMAIRDLMQHGLMEVGQSSSLVPFGCFPNRSAQATHMLHAWDLFLKFYEMKHGREYNESPARKLSQSFHLDMIGGKAITAKQTLLGAIDTVINSHTPFKRSEDTHLKAFICMALNERKLVTWMRLIFRTQTLIDTYYQDWSYVARTGFEDALRSLERLLVINFNLPVDLAVRPFSNIKDAF